MVVRRAGRAGKQERRGSEVCKDGGSRPASEASAHLVDWTMVLGFSSKRLIREQITTKSLKALGSHGPAQRRPKQLPPKKKLRQSLKQYERKNRKSHNRKNRERNQLYSPVSKQYKQRVSRRKDEEAQGIAGLA